MLPRWLLLGCISDEVEPRDDESAELSRVLRQFNCNFERAVVLICRGANPNTESLTGHSVLQLAAATQPQWVPLLLTLGADPNHFDNHQRNVFENCFKAFTNEYRKAEALLAIIQYDKVSAATQQVFHNWLTSRFAIINKTLQACQLLERKWKDASYVYKHISPVTLRLALYYEGLHYSPSLKIVRILLELVLASPTQPSQSGLENLPKDLLITIFHTVSESQFTREEIKQLMNYLYSIKPLLKEYLRRYGGIQWFYDSKQEAMPFTVQPPLGKLLYEYQVVTEKEKKAGFHSLLDQGDELAREKQALEKQYRDFRHFHSVGLFKSSLNQLAYKERWQNSQWAKASAAGKRGSKP